MKKTSLNRKIHGHYIIRVINPDAFPYRLESNRDKAWRVVRLMNGLTVETAHKILESLEPNIQGEKKRPLGWIVDAIDRGVIEITSPDI